MKKLLLVAVAATGLTATPAFAQASDTAVQNFDGERAIECTITGVNNVQFGTLTSNGDAAAQTDSGITVFCNQPSTASFSSLNGYLALFTTNPANDSNSQSDLTSGANPGFAAGVDYSANILGFAGLNADTTQIPGNNIPVAITNVPAINETNVSIEYDTIAGSQPLLGGSYRDTLTVTLTTTGV